MKIPGDIHTLCRTLGALKPDPDVSEEEWEQMLAPLREAAADSPGAAMCPACGGLMVVRRGKYGKFRGCENYPTCKHTERCNHVPIETM